MTVPKAPFWSLHSHSVYSVEDALPTVPQMVSRAVELGYPALGLTDHGSVTGTVQLYKAANKAGIKPLPGIELYITPDVEHKIQGKDHLTVVAYTESGYRNLVHLANLCAQNFYYKPQIDMALLAGMAEDGKTQGLAVGTGCYFGAVQQTLIERGDRAAVRMVKALAGWFPRVYVELHFHGVPDGYNTTRFTELELMNEMIAIAEEVGLPYILAADSHYTHSEHQPVHDFLKQLISFDAENPNQFPGGPYCMVDRGYYDAVLPWYGDVVDRACDNLAELAEKASVRIPELDTFTAKMPDVTLTGDADRELRALVMQKLTEANASPAEYTQAERELEVMAKIGAAGYILLVWWICDFMDKQDIWFHTRGSASGSLVCYRLGITQIDPIKGDLRFDRFMSPDRISMPDIDLDVQHDRRDEVVAALDRFSVRQVGSLRHYKITDDEEDEDEDSSKGSLLVKYYSTQKKLGRPVASWDHIPKHERDLIKKLADMKPMSGYGTHAAGYIVAPDEASVAELPLAWMSNRSAFVTAYDKKDVEALGFVKIDLLGLKMLTAIRLACEAICPDDPRGFWESIPYDDKETYRRISAGETTGTFQFDGKSFTYGVKELKPKNFKEIIAAQALFRPGSTGSQIHKRYIARRNGKEPVPDRHADIMTATKETYGTLLYQEQVLQVSRAMGMPSKELTALLDALKASNDNVEAARKHLEEARPYIRSLAEKRGWSNEDIDWFLDALKAYSEYGFNKAHAASYGRVTYRSSYLAANYPLQWWWAVLVAYRDSKKVPQFLRAIRRIKPPIWVRQPHVNKSGASYTIDGAHIRKGLVTIKGVGPVAAAELAAHAPYASLQDLGERVAARKVSGAKGLAMRKEPAECGGVVAALHDAGALDGLS